MLLYLFCLQQAMSGEQLLSTDGQEFEDEDDKSNTEGTQAVASVK